MMKRRSEIGVSLSMNVRKRTTAFSCYLMPMIILVMASVSVPSMSTSTWAYSLEGKTALVTGSAGGIGKGIAQVLVDRGAKVIIHYNTREEEAKEFSSVLGPNRCLGVLQCDFTAGYDKMKQFMDDVQTLCRQCHDDDAQQHHHRQQQEDEDTGTTASPPASSSSSYPPLDILVNNAGVVSKLALEDDDSNLSNWHQTMDVNLHAPLFLSKLFVDAHKSYHEGEGYGVGKAEAAAAAAGGGVIVHVGSIHGEKSNEYMGAYAASKAALESITRTMAIEFAPMDIRVNTIAPGVVPVERTAVAFSDPVTMKSWTDRLPLQRTGTVSEIANACLPLFENDWITGSTWQIDGGMMSRANMPQRPRPPPPPS